MVCAINRVVSTVREHIATQKAPCIRRSICIRVDEPADGRVIIAALEIVEAGLGIIVIAAVAQGVEVGDAGGIGEDFRTAVIHRAVAPGVIVVGRSEFAVRVQQRNDVALRVENVVVERRGRAVVIDHGERLVAIVVDKLKCFAVPLLPHDLAGERGVVVRRAIDRFAGADTGHVVGVGDLLAVDRCGGKLAALRPREGIILAVVIRDRVAGGRDAARLGLAFVENVLRRATDCHAREQVRPRGVRVAKGLYDRAVGRDAADVAHRVIGVGAGHAAVGLGRKLALRVVGIRLRGGCRGHIRAAGRDRLDVAGRVVGIVEAAAA